LNPGTYTVSLTVTGPGGSDTVTKTDIVVVESGSPPPPPPPTGSIQALFSGSPLTGSAPLQVAFTDLSTCTGAIGSWAWDFGDGNSSSQQDPVHTYTSAGTYTASLVVTSGTLSDTKTKTAYIQVSAPPPPPPPGPNPLVYGSLHAVGVPPGGLPVISDLEVFGGKLWLMESQNPLATWGAKVFTWDGTNFNLELSDTTSQGYLRGRVINNKLYIPDCDPNGYDPGIVYVWTSGTGSPTATSVTSAVHNFDVVEYNGQTYTTGGLRNGSSSLNVLSGSTWSVASQGSFSRLKYATVFDGKIWASKRNIGSAAELVRIDSTMTQTGLDVIQGTEALCTDLQVINNKMYMTVWGQTGVLHCFVQPTSHNIVNLTGISSDLIWEYCLHSDGNIYGVAMFGIYGSQDGTSFTKIISVSDNRFGQPGGNNADGRASIASYNGKLYVGSSTNGTLYEIR
ncbi:MAG: PKD domain-containing protein, partial [Planctomycetota bacterium]